MRSSTLSRQAAVARAEALRDLLLDIGAAKSSREIADELIRRGVPTARGGCWHPQSVMRLLRHAGIVPGVEIRAGHQRQLPPRSVSACITSPPYGLQRQRQYGGTLDADFPQWTVKWLREIEPSLVIGGNVAIILRSHIVNGEVSPFIRETVTAARAAGWKEPGELFRYVPDAMPAGHRNRPRQACDTILWLSNSIKPYNNPTANGRPSSRIGARGSKGQEAGSYRHGTSEYRDGIARCTNFAVIPDDDCTNVIISPNAGCHKAAWNHHPAQHPQALKEWLIRLLSPSNGLIIDPFVGSGTTAVAALATGRRFVGVDVRHDYIQIAKRRISEAALKIRNPRS